MPVDSLWVPGWLGEPRTHRRGPRPGRLSAPCSRVASRWDPPPHLPGRVGVPQSRQDPGLRRSPLSGPTALPFPRLPCPSVSLPGSARLVITHFLSAPPAVSHLSIICLCVCCLSTCMSAIYKSIIYLLSIYLYIICLYIYHLSIIYQSIYVSLIHVSISPHLSDSPWM